MVSARDECDEKWSRKWRATSAKNYGIIRGIFVPVNAPARQPRDRQRGSVQEGFGTATDQVECRSKSSFRQACRAPRLTAVSSTSYAGSWRIRVWVKNSPG